MRFTVDTSALKLALQRVEDAVPNQRMAAPIEFCVLIEARGDDVTLTTSCADMTLTTQLPIVPVASKGRCAVRHALLLEVAKSLPAGSTVAIALDGTALALECGATKCRLAVLDADTFPALPSTATEQSGNVDGALLARLIDRVVYAISKDPTRWVLNGAMLEGTDSDALMACATDGHRLAWANEAGIWGAALTRPLIVPKPALAVLRSMCGAASLTLGTRAGWLVASTPDVTMAARCIDDTFPDYRQVLPASSEGGAKVVRKALLGALARVAVLAGETRGVVLAGETRGVVLTLRTNLVAIDAQSDTDEAHDEVVCEYTGEPQRMGINAAYLKDALTALDSEHVVLTATDELAPLLISVPDDANVRACVMPMRLKAATTEAA